ncbi:MAG: hypothetical protein BA865_15600 [Desulfobacterales bacterium S5133MH4]|nr:MAG: hypothetical protein BA865_15600 [Desulfobacterales bacterium S5133MH4]
MSKKLPRIDPSLLAIVAEGFLSRLSFGIISFTLPLYAHHLGLSLTEIGFLISLNLAVAMALKPIMGWIADRSSLKWSYVASLGLRSLVSLALAFAAQPWQLYSIRIVHGTSRSLRDPAANALIAEHGGKKAIASAFAWYSTAKSVAGALGGALAGTLLTLSGTNFSFIFIVAFVLSVVPIFVVARSVVDQKVHDDPVIHTQNTSIDTATSQITTAPKRTTDWIKSKPPLLPFIGLGFLISSTARMLLGLFPVLAVEYAGLNTTEVGMIGLIAATVRLVAGPLFGWLSDNVSRRLVLLVRSAANVLSSVIYIVAPNFMGMLSGRVVDDAGKAAFRPAWGALMADMSSFDKRNRARTMALLSTGEDAGGIVGPILAGFLWNTWGIGVMLGARVVVAVISEIYAVTVTHSMMESVDYRLKCSHVARVKTKME